MSNEKQISLKKYLVISDDEWKKIKNTEDEMYRIWEKIKSTDGIKEIEKKNIYFINEKFLSKDDNATTEKIYHSILREVCGKNIPRDFRHVKLQIPSVKGKLTINDIILNIRRLKQEDGTDFNRLDIKLIFWLMYSIMSSVMPKKAKSETAEQEKMEADKKDICLYAACMGMQVEEFPDVLNIIQYILNDTLNIKACKASRTKFLEELCSDIIENTSDMEENEEDQEDIFKKYFEARHTLIYVRTLEEKEIIKHIAKIVNNHPEIAEKIYQWNTSDGLVNLQTGIHREDAEIMDISQYTLEHAIKSISDKLDSNSNIREVYIFRTIELGMKDASTISRIKILAEKIRDIRANVFLIFLARDIHIDSTLEKDFYIDMDFYYPKAWRIKEVLEDFLESKSIHIEQSALDDIAYSCKGLTTVEINSALELAYVTLNRRFEKNKFLQFLQDAKKQSLKKSGLLELIEEKSTVRDIGGLSELIEWLNKKSIIINNISSARKEHVAVPKGILLVGMPGCGKSLCAKCAAGLFNVPLFRLDVGSLLNKYVGESERNFSDALLLAEAASPCVLWIDEMEKAFPNDSDGKNQSEVSAKMLGKFLTWMQEKKTLTFVVATVNKAKNIPVELTRHGRFDERFFVDFPNAKERAGIIALHLEKKGITFTDVKYIVKKTEGYSGAELEHIIRVITKERFINKYNEKGTGVTKAMFAEAIKSTRPISETNKEAIKEIKDYCKQNNIRSANKK
jgi:SpoVK/Ycf46/Vps4 family AAA+-type ATPase